MTVLNYVSSSDNQPINWNELWSSIASDLEDVFGRPRDELDLEARYEKPMMALKGQLTPLVQTCLSAFQEMKQISMDYKKNLLDQIDKFQDRIRILNEQYGHDDDEAALNGLDEEESGLFTWLDRLKCQSEEITERNNAKVQEIKAFIEGDLTAALNSISHLNVSNFQERLSVFLNQDNDTPHISLSYLAIEKKVKQVQDFLSLARQYEIAVGLERQIESLDVFGGQTVVTGSSKDNHSLEYGKSLREFLRKQWEEVIDVDDLFRVELSSNFSSLVAKEEQLVTGWIEMLSKLRDVKMKNIQANLESLRKWLQLVISITPSGDGGTLLDMELVFGRDQPNGLLQTVVRPWLSKVIKLQASIPIFNDDEELLSLCRSVPDNILPMNNADLKTALNESYSLIRERQRKLFEAKIEEARKGLEAVWDKLETQDWERQEFWKGPIDSVLYTEKGLLIIREETDRLQLELRDKKEILKLIRDRRELIEKMIGFESSASDPARLFKSSFQLVQEEKFRKTAYPSLLKLEQEMVKKISAWEASKGRIFVHNTSSSNNSGSTSMNRSYLHMLEQEQRERYVNETFFGFHGFNASGSNSGNVQAAGNVSRSASLASLSSSSSPPKLGNNGRKANVKK